MKVERALLDPDGLVGRPWFKHLIYAPRPTYKALVLPALTEAIEAGDQTRAKREVARLTRALNRAAKAINPLATKKAQKSQIKQLTNKSIKG